MVLLKDLSVLWAMIHTLVMFLFLFESRYPRKKTLTISLLTMVPLITVNVLLFILLGFEHYGTLMLLTLSLPSCIVFWFLAKYRDGRFFFTFCMVDTIVLEIVYITNILNHYTTPDTYILMFAVRLISYPLIECWVYKQLRPMYLNVQKHVKNGWGMFAIIGILFYIAITLMMTIPNVITSRPDQLPALIILFTLMPVIYLYIIFTLQNQLKIHEMSLQEDILNVQVTNLSSRMEELSKADDRFRMERHNFRHKLSTLAALIQNAQYDECLKLLSEYGEDLDKTTVVHYCQHKVLDAVFAAYIPKARQRHIRLDLGLALPDSLPVKETELATVIANAFENAILACERVTAENRFIEIKIVDYPRLMVRIANSFDGNIRFDENKIPVANEENHGFGTRFIAAFCSKNECFFDFSADDHTFTILLNF